MRDSTLAGIDFAIPLESLAATHRRAAETPLFGSSNRPVHPVAQSPSRSRPMDPTPDRYLLTVIGVGAFFGVEIYPETSFLLIEFTTISYSIGSLPV